MRRRKILCCEFKNPDAFAQFWNIVELPISPNWTLASPATSAMATCPKRDPPR
jgi:hypothetical protein